MKLIIGGKYQGKLDYVRKNILNSGMELYDGRLPDPDASGKVQAEAVIINNLQDYIFDCTKNSVEPLESINSFLEKNPKAVIICDEIGCGLVPVDALDRQYREKAGRIITELASKADEVIRVICGIGQIIKRKSVDLVLIRHGMTQGNSENRYVGTTDEKLCIKGSSMIEENRMRGLYPPVDAVFASPMRRCIQTAGIIYPSAPITLISEWAEMDFGRFEYHSYEELKDDPDYIRWIDNNVEDSFSDCEDREHFIERVRRGMYKAHDILFGKAAFNGTAVKRVAFIVHGGTIMALTSSFSGCSYYDYQAENGKGYSCNMTDKDGVPEISSVRKLDCEQNILP